VRRFIWVLLLATLIVVVMLAVLFGTASLELGAIWGALRGVGDTATLAIVRDIRLPRVALAALVGAGLGMSGAALQGTMRNPLAEPYLLGVSGGAAVGAVIAVGFHATASFVPLVAFVGALGAVVLVLGIARLGAGMADTRVLLMAGVVIGAFTNAVILLVLANAPADNVRGALWWMMGSVGGASWESVRWLALYVAGIGAALVFWARDIDILALGDEPAAGLGVRVEQASRRIYILASMLAAATVAAAGLVGFVGLIVPHLVRGGAGHRHRAVVLASGLAGAALLVAADLLARTVRAPAELPLGAVTALAGVPFFLAQLRRFR
jgi:iron complex transport system permease protein